MRQLTRRLTLFGSAAFVVSLLAPRAAAEPEPRESKRYQVQTKLSGTKAGAARVRVATPIAEVRRVVRDFAHYSKFIPQFEKAKVVGRVATKTDVFLQVPILNGAAKIWAVVRFEPVKSEAGEERLEGHMVEGNVKRLDAWWRFRAVDEETTELHLELLIVPKFPVPSSLITKQAAYAADQAVLGSRSRAETEWKKKKKKKGNKRKR